MYDFTDEDRTEEDPTREQIIERCKAIRKEKQNWYVDYDPSSFERGVAKLLTDVYKSPVYIPYKRYFDW